MKISSTSTHSLSDIPKNLRGVKSNMANVELAATITPYKGPKTQLFSRLFLSERIIPGRTGMVVIKTKNDKKPKVKEKMKEKTQTIDLNTINLSF